MAPSERWEKKQLRGLEGDAVHTDTLPLYPLRHVLHTSAARRVL
jgi:hypothetical protein